MNFKYLLRLTNLLFVVLAGLVLMTACSSSGQQKQPAITSTAIPTITPTYYFVQLPSSIQSASGWKINLSALDLQTALGETKSKNKMFLVGLVEIENLTGKSACIKSDQFMLLNKLQKIKMEREFLEAGKSAYARDYPGTILGQCLDANEKQESVLVFDIPATSEDLSLNFQEQTMRLGKIEAIRNPLPTLTSTATVAPTATVIVPPTSTFTPTLTPNATAIPTIAPSKTTAPTPTKKVSALIPGLTPADITENLKKIGLICSPAELGKLYYVTTCQKDNVEFSEFVMIYGRGLFSVDYIDSSIINYTNVANELPKVFMGFLATVTYDGAVQDEAKMWVEATVPTIKKQGDSAEKVFAGVTYRLSGLPNFITLEMGALPE